MLLRAAWRLEQAERERSWALASARAEGLSIRALAAAVRLSSSRVHQIVAAADHDELDAQLGELREAGAAEQAAALASRLPGAGMFELFREHEDRQDRFRFGREADGSPAGRWGWEDLD